MLQAVSLDDAYRSLTPEDLPGEARSYWHRNAGLGEAHYILEVIEPDGSRLRHGPVSATAAPTPTVLWVSPPSPNPAGEAVEWQLALPAPGRVHLVIHDVAGRVSATVVDAIMPAGMHRIPWDRRLRNAWKAPAGVYFFRLDIGAQTRVGKLVLGPLP